MRPRSLIVVVAALAAGVLAHASPIQTLWDNYLSPVPGYDRLGYFSSEVSASVPDAYAGDDAIFTGSVVIQEIKWLGMRNMAYTYGSAEVVILDASFSILHSLTGLSYSSTTITDSAFPWGYTPYEGTVAIPNILLPAGHYYFAVRLVSGTPDAPTGGRNFVLTTGGGAIHGNTMGVIRVPAFGAPNWTLIGNYFGSRPTEYAYRIRGQMVPEPAGLLLLVLGGLLAWRR